MTDQSHLKVVRTYRQGRALSPYAAAKSLGLSWTHFKRAIAAGEVEVRTFGGKRYITHAEIERLKKLTEQML